MSSWAEESENYRMPITRTADSLSDDISELADTECIHFEGLAKSMSGRGSEPKCVDCMIVSRDRVHLVEFKPLPSGKDDGIQCSLHLKATESAVLYIRFLSERYGDKVDFILVTQDNRRDLVGPIASRAGMTADSRLSRYRKHDINGDTMFYDDVMAMGCREFVAFVRKRACRQGTDRRAVGQ